MQTYFTANQPHLQGSVDIASVTFQTYYYIQQPSIYSKNDENIKNILTLGIDSMIYMKNVGNSNNKQDEKRISLDESKRYNRIARCDKEKNCCYLGTQTGTIQMFNLQTQQSTIIFTSTQPINQLTISPSSKYLSISSQQSKPILLDLTSSHQSSLQSSKCRPGLQSQIISSSFSYDQQYLAVLGKNRLLVIYNIGNFNQPLEKYRRRISSLGQVSGEIGYFKGVWNKYLRIYYCPGEVGLQIVQLLNQKFQYRTSSTIKHPHNCIVLVSFVKNSTLITSSKTEIILWNNKTEEKIVYIEQNYLYKVIEIDEKLYAVKGDGGLYQYKKEIVEAVGYGNRNNNNKMEIEYDDRGNNNNNRKQIDMNNDVISFDNENGNQQHQQHQQQHQQINQQNHAQDNTSNISQQQLEYTSKKKSKADLIIKVLPQQKITTHTSLFDGSHYLYTSASGYIVQKIQSQQQTHIIFESQQYINNELLFINKQIKYVDMNSLYMVYGNDMIFGVKFIGKIKEIDSWEKMWWDVVAVVGSVNWIAVANEEEIKIFDLVGNQIKSVCFDRQIVAMTAYQNLLSVVYHQSVPIWGQQCLTMQLFIINLQQSSLIKLSTCHVPIKPKSHLKYFRFSSQGMLLSQDTNGQIRVYNLQYNCWISIIIDGIEDIRRIWILGMENYQLVYWRTTEINPDPIVFPRLPVKSSMLGVSSVGVDGMGEEMEKNYPYLMFRRFCLDHDKSRLRLWSHLLLTRSKNHPFFSNISSIPSIKTLLNNHNQLDYKFFSIFKYFIKQKQLSKILITAKSLIRTIQAGKQLIQMIDQCKLRYIAVELQKYYDEKKKELQYEAIKRLDLQKLKVQAQRLIKPKVQNPFAAKKNKQHNEMSSIPSLNNSQYSSNFDNFSQKSFHKPTKQNGISLTNKTFIDTPQKQQISNPFVKKNNDTNVNMIKSKEIEEQIEKFGIKKKVESKKNVVGYRGGMI